MGWFCIGARLAWLASLLVWRGLIDFGARLVLLGAGLMFLAVAVHEGDGVHGFFAFGLELFDDDEITVSTFYHERGGGFAVEPSGFAENIGDAQDAGFENDTGFVEESVFWFREALVGDDLAEQFEGAILVRLEK